MPGCPGCVVLAVVVGARRASPRLSHSPVFLEKKKKRKNWEQHEGKKQERQEGQEQEEGKGEEGNPSTGPWRKSWHHAANWYFYAPSSQGPTWKLDMGDSTLATFFFFSFFLLLAEILSLYSKTTTH